MSVAPFDAFRCIRKNFQGRAAAVKLFRRRERKIGTGADVLAYVKVVPVAPFDAYGRIFKAEEILHPYKSI